MNYSVTIEMSSSTVNQLVSNGFYLYALRAVKGPSNGQPVVWFRTSGFSTRTQVAWVDQYQAYTSSSQIMPYAQIMVNAAFPIALGQTLNVTSGGIGTVVGSGTPGAIDIVNQTSSMFTCGVSGEQPSGGSAPLCAFPLFGYQMIGIAPLEQVFLMFGTQPVNTGTVIEQAFGEGILVDLTGTPSQTVSYDTNMGWSGGNGATTYPPNVSLQPLLIKF